MSPGCGCSKLALRPETPAVSARERTCSRVVPKCVIACSLEIAGTFRERHWSVLLCAMLSHVLPQVPPDLPACRSPTRSERVELPCTSARVRRPWTEIRWHEQCSMAGMSSAQCTRACNSLVCCPMFYVPEELLPQGLIRVLSSSAQAAAGELEGARPAWITQLLADSHSIRKSAPLCAGARRERKCALRPFKPCPEGRSSALRASWAALQPACPAWHGKT